MKKAAIPQEKLVCGILTPTLLCCGLLLPYNCIILHILLKILRRFPKATVDQHRLFSWIQRVSFFCIIFKSSSILKFPSKIKDFFDVRAFALSSNKNTTDFVQAQVCYIFVGWHCSLLTPIISYLFMNEKFFSTSKELPKTSGSSSVLSCSMLSVEVTHLISFADHSAALWFRSFLFLVCILECVCHIITT